ncbi:hypothetical protein [Nitrososphaera sp.]|uniref:hypothetical protein n=1 Tax=Nitrososphaera sp. TaxID=1971748 RepID=UPI00307E7E9A
MRYNNEPSALRKIAMSIAAGLAAIAFFALIFTSSYFFLPPKSPDNTESAPTKNTLAGSGLTVNHGHAELTVLVNGDKLDFSKPEYQNKSIRIHLEDNDGSTLHIHDRSTRIEVFFESVGMSLDNNCLQIQDGTSYCSNFDNQIIFSVNGMANAGFQYYIPANGDTIVVSYGKIEHH